MTKLAAPRDVNIYTISKAVMEDLGYKSFTSGPSLRFFSDEKLFNLDRSHTGRTPGGSARTLRTCPWSSSPRTGSVMVLSVVSSDGDVMASHFFSVGLRTNQEVYLVVLRCPG
ncbi:Uncharacterized protein FKW44_013575 [Caligus rogercresseyi]|uniref:Uncharacterized protein n=1 Tax=Caligus rogercresseyi TaxID=217165 RepID=A0A7T8JZC6_CALRO|nr:Uncharacterized protein FKW44_013575 [Caligus rogercresseyi]